jgi:hypothetical protein
VDPGISSLSSIVSYGLSSVVGINRIGVSSLSSIVSYGLSSLRVAPGISSLSSIVSYGLSSLRVDPGISSLSSIVSYGLSSVNILINRSVTTQTLQVFSNILLGSNGSNNFIAFSGDNNNFNNRVIAEYGQNLLVFAGADSGTTVNRNNNLALAASKGIYFYTDCNTVTWNNNLNLQNPNFFSENNTTTFNTQMNFCNIANFSNTALFSENVGINNKTPTNLLDVFGDTQIDGYTNILVNPNPRIVVGEEGRIEKFINYRPTQNILGDSIKDIKYYNSNFIAVGKSIYHSTDGINWTDISNTVTDVSSSVVVGLPSNGQGRCVFYDISANHWIVTGNWDGIPLYYTSNSTGLDGWTYIYNTATNRYPYITTNTFTYIHVNSDEANISLIGVDNSGVTMYYASGTSTPDRAYYKNFANYTPITLSDPGTGLVTNYIYSHSSGSYLATGSNSVNRNINVIYSSDGITWYPSINDISGGSEFFTTAGYGITTDFSRFIVVGDDISGNNIFISQDSTGSTFFSQARNNYIPSLSNVPLYDIQNLNTLQTDPNTQYNYYNNSFILTSRTNNSIYIISDLDTSGQAPTRTLTTSTTPNRLAYYTFNIEDDASLTVHSAKPIQYTSPTTKGYGGIHINPTQFSTNGNITGITIGTSFSSGNINSTQAGILTTGNSDISNGSVLHIMNSRNALNGMEEVITINGTNNNNLGIKNTNPAYTLDVNGIINTSETVRYSTRQPLIVYMNISNSSSSMTPIRVAITSDSNTYYDYTEYVAVINGWDIKGTAKPITTVTAVKNSGTRLWDLQFDTEVSSSFTTANFVFTISPIQMYDIRESSVTIGV